MPPLAGRHRLGRSELAALATDETTAETIGWLQKVILSKNKLLLEGVRRTGKRTLTREVTGPLESAVGVLADIQAHAPDVVDDVLLLPQMGAWATECLSLLGRQGRAAPDSIRADLSYFMALVAVAGLRAHRPFELTMWTRDGKVALPDTGTLFTPGDGREIQVRFDGDRLTICAGTTTVVLEDLASPGELWSPVPRVRVASDGLALDAAVEFDDLFLARYGRPMDRLDTAGQQRWELRFQEAWRILAKHHRPTAAALAAGLTTLVPLVETSSGRSTSATSASACGAIALSLPPDPLSLAETLVHELQHLVLGIVEDLTTLVFDDHGELSYAPWRDDPRPPAELLQGCYAYLAITGFWRRQRGAGLPEQRQRADAEFARWRGATLAATQTLTSSGVLTDAGETLVARVLRRLLSWQAEAVDAEAERFADEARTEHHLRWRIAQLRPDPAVVEALARAWRSGGRPETSRVPVTITPTSPLRSRTRLDMLELRYRDPARFRQIFREPASPATKASRGQADLALQQADIALLHGDTKEATRRYEERLATEDDPDAWVGLALAKGRAGSAESWQLLSQHLEVVAALHERLRLTDGAPPPLDPLIAWLIGVRLS